MIFAKRELDNGRWETEIGAPILRSLIISTIVLLDLSIPNDPPDTTMLDPRWFLARTIEVCFFFMNFYWQWNNIQTFGSLNVYFYTEFMRSEPLLWTDPECKCTTI